VQFAPDPLALPDQGLLSFDAGDPGITLAHENSQ
jgi:hypothetical protein